MNKSYTVYTNLQIFIEEYRQMEHTPFLEYPAFIDVMQKKQQLSTMCHKNGEPILIILFAEKSEYLKASGNFRSFMTSLNNNRQTIYTITEKPLNNFISKLIHTFENLKIEPLLYRHFVIVIPRGPFCSEHTILSPDETKECMGDLFAHPASLPSISVKDPQCIWIGAEIGQVIRIRSISRACGFSIRYRIVVPANGYTEFLQSEEGGVLGDADLFDD